MATMVQSRSQYSSGNGSTVARAFASNVTANNCIVAAVGAYDDTENVDSVTDSLANTYTAIGTQVRAGDDTPFAFLHMFQTISGSGGANTVTGNFSASVGDRHIFIFEVSGVDTGTPVEANANGSTVNGNTVVTGNVVMNNPGMCIKAMLEWNWIGLHDPAFGTPTTGWTEEGDNSNGGDSAYQNFTTTGTRTGGFGNGSSDWVCKMVALRDASAPTAPFPPFKRHVDVLLRM